MRKNVLPITAGVLGSLALAVSASADFLGASIVEMDLGAGEGFVTYRVVAHFDGPDLMLAWGAIPGKGELHFWTGNGVDLLNDSASPFFGLKQEDFAQAPISAEWDSWVTVGATGFAGNNTDYSPGFLGSNGLDAVVVGNAFWETDGLVFNANPDLPWFGPDVVIAQFTIPGVPNGVPGTPGHNGFHLEGIVAWSQAGAGFTVSPFVVDNIPAPGALALLGLAGLAGARRRRRCH